MPVNSRQQTLALCLDATVVIVIRIFDMFLFEVFHKENPLQIKQPNAALYVVENGCKRRELPKKYGDWHVIYVRGSAGTAGRKRARRKRRLCACNIWGLFKFK